MKNSDRAKTETLPLQLSFDVVQQSFVVPFEYPVHFTRNLFDHKNVLLASAMNRLKEDRKHRAMVYVDQGLYEEWPDLLGSITGYFEFRPKKLELAAPPLVIPGGEGAKSGWDTVRNIMTAIGDLHLDRQSFVVAVGGGSLLDMVGFAASIVHRGLRFIRVPTTTLAQNDAGIGVKNGMNEHGQKNFVGTFSPPFAVLNDFAFLSTLSQRDWIGGVAEAFKVAIIKDADFFEYLCDQANELRARNIGAMETTIRHCAVLHLEHIRTNGDPFEFGSARPLDFGHWAAHKLEVMSGYTMGHGQAVAIGLAIDSYYAMRQELIAREDFDLIIEGLLNCGLPVWSSFVEAREPDGQLEVLDGLDQFREHLGGQLTVTLPDGIGGKIEVHELDTELVKEAIEYLNVFADQEKRA